MKFFILAIILALLVSCSSSKLVLSEGELLNDLHRSNVGHIAFMNDYIPFDEYTESDFKEEVVHSEKKDLSFRMFLGKTLSHYLNELAPELTVEQLCKKGNFEITFLVNGKQVFKEQVNPGAGSCWFKNSATAYRIPLVSLEEEDHWGRFLWTRFLYKEGGIDALAGVSRNLKVEVRPYIKTDEVLVGDVIASGSVVIKSQEEVVEVDEELVKIQEIADHSGWKLSSSEFDLSLIQQMNKDIAAKKLKDISSVVVLKDEKLLIEEYFNGSNRSEKHNTRSVGKSFMSAIMGLAIDQGHIKSVDQKISEFYKLEKYKNFSKAKADVTIRDLLTMSSGFDGDDSNMDSKGNEEYMYPTKNWVKFGLDLEMKEDRNWTYFTAGSVILGDIIHQSVPGGLEAFAEEHFFEPLGIQDYVWQYTPQGVANTAGGIQMSALDFALFGQLYKNNGRWKGHQILSEEWVGESFQEHAVINEDNKDYYGYQFWEKTFTVGEKEYTANFCTGTGGNKIYIFEDLPLVIVITAKAYRLPQAHSQVKRMMEKYILPAVI